MTRMLTPEQLRAVAENPDEPLRLADPDTKKVYFLLSEEVFRKVQAVLEQEFQPRDAYAVVDRVFAAGWNDPKMDDYDHYEEIKQ
jgi:hypothetical protein